MFAHPFLDNAFLRVVGIAHDPPVSVTFEPASTGRVYTLQANTNGLRADGWHNITGQTRQPGAGGTDALEDGAAADAAFYRVTVELP